MTLEQFVQEHEFRCCEVCASKIMPGDDVWVGLHGEVFCRPECLLELYGNHYYFTEDTSEAYESCFYKKYSEEDV